MLHLQVELAIWFGNRAGVTFVQSEGECERLGFWGKARSDGDEKRFEWII